MIRSLTRFLKPRTARPSVSSSLKQVLKMGTVTLALTALTTPVLAETTLDDAINHGLTWGVKVVRYGCLAVLAGLAIKHAVEWAQSRENPSMAHAARSHFFLYAGIFVGIVMAKMVLVGALTATGNDASLLPSWLCTGLGASC